MHPRPRLVGEIGVDLWMMLVVGAAMSFGLARGHRRSWRDLKLALGNRLSQVSILVPIVGYLIIFNDEFVDALSRSFLYSGTLDGNVPLNLFMLYFGFTMIAVAAIIYDLAAHASVKTMTKTEVRQWCADNFGYYWADHFFEQALRGGRLNRDEDGVSRVIERLRPKVEEHLGQGSDTQAFISTYRDDLNVVFERYQDYENLKAWPLRTLTFTLFLAGTALVTIPAAMTFGRVAAKAAQQGLLLPP